MGDENSIRTIGGYSKPSHEGYRNNIELPVGNNVVPLRSDTINGCSFHRLRSEDPNQHLKDLLKLVDSLDLDGDNRERTRLRDPEFMMEIELLSTYKHENIVSLVRYYGEGMHKILVYRLVKNIAKNPSEEYLDERRFYAKLAQNHYEKEKLDEIIESNLHKKGILGEFMSEFDTHPRMEVWRSALVDQLMHPGVAQISLKKLLKKLKVAYHHKLIEASDTEVIDCWGMFIDHTDCGWKYLELSVNIP
ncbi:MAK10-like protein [Tanacetum coccineum]